MVKKVVPSSSNRDGHEDLKPGKNVTLYRWILSKMFLEPFREPTMVWKICGRFMFATLTLNVMFSVQAAATASERSWLVRTVFLLWETQVLLVALSLRSETNSFVLQIYNNIVNCPRQRDVYEVFMGRVRFLLGVCIGNAALVSMGFLIQSDDNPLHDLLVRVHPWLEEYLAFRVFAAVMAVLFSLYWIMPLIQVACPTYTVYRDFICLENKVENIANVSPVERTVEWKSLMQDITAHHLRLTRSISFINRKLGRTFAIIAATTLALITFLTYQAVLTKDLTLPERLLCFVWIISGLCIAFVISIPCALISSATSRLQRKFPVILAEPTECSAEIREIFNAVMPRFDNSANHIRLGEVADITWELIFKFASIYSSAILVMYNISNG